MIIKVKVKPNSNKQSLTYNKEKDEYLVQLKSPAKDNKANIELLKLLKKEFGKLPKILTGKTSHSKIIKFRG